MRHFKLFWLFLCLYLLLFSVCFVFKIRCDPGFSLYDVQSLQATMILYACACACACLLHMLLHEGVVFVMIFVCILDNV